MAIQVYAVSRLFQDGKLAGFVLMDSTGRVRNISCEQVMAALKSGAKIANLECVNGEIKGVGGRLDRYAAVSTKGELLNKPSITVFELNEYSDSKKYVCGTYTGKRLILSANEIFFYSQTYVITNRKVFKNKLNTVCIVPIDSSTASSTSSNDEQGQISIKDKKITKKYVLPSIEPKAEFIRGYKEGNISNVYRHKRLTGFEWITPQMIYKKRGLCRYDFDYEAEKEVVYYPDSGFNELLIQGYKGRTHQVRITGFKLYDDVQFLVDTDAGVFMLNDIIYIGKNWYSITNVKNKPLPLSMNMDGTSLIGLGQIGLVIIYFNIKDEVINAITIPYSKIETIDGLANSLVSVGITAGILDSRDVGLILNAARRCPYRSRFGVKITDIPLLSKNRTSGDDSEYSRGLFEIVIVECENIKNVNEYYLSTPKHLKMALYNELKCAVKPGEIACFSDYEKVIRGSGEETKLKLVDGDYRIEYMSTRIRYIAYLILGKLKLLGEEFNPVLINEKDQREIIKNYLWGYSVINDKLYMMLGDNRIAYSIPGVIAQYKADLGIGNSISKSVAKTSVKMGLLGVNSRMESNGYISNWTNDTILDQTPALKGVILTDECSNNKLIIHSTGSIDVIDERTRVRWTRSSVVYTFKADTLKHAVVNNDELKQKVNIGINLSGATAKEIDFMLAYLFRRYIFGRITIDGKETNIKQDSFEYTMPFMIKNAKLVFKPDEFDSEKSNLKELTFNQNNTPDENKIEMIKMCMASMPRGKVARNIALNIIEIVITLLFDDEKRDKVMASFDKWKQQYV